MIKRFLSLFGKPEVKKAPVKKRAVSSGQTRTLNALKSEIKNMQTRSGELNDELARIKEHVTKMPDHSGVIDGFHKKHESHERKLETHTEKFGHIEGKLNDHRIDVIELKSRLNELSASVARFDSLFGKVAELERRAVEEPQQKIMARVAKARAPSGSLIEQYHSFAPSTKKIFSLLLGMHIEHKGKWVPLSNLRNRVYPDSDNSKSTLAAMAKAIRPLYETGFVDKKRDKSFVYVAASKRGREAAKEVGLEQQAEKFDKAFAQIGE